MPRGEDMNIIETKAAIFDVLKELDTLNVKATELNNKKNELLRQLETAKE
jgi:hypothetical protein